jgi:hypothetical protein
VGPLPADSPVLKDFESNLKREGMAGESFVLNKEAISPPKNRRVETASGVKLTFPISLAQSVVSVDIWVQSPTAAIEDEAQAMLQVPGEFIPRDALAQVVVRPEFKLIAAAELLHGGGGEIASTTPAKPTTTPAPAG